MHLGPKTALLREEAPGPPGLPEPADLLLHALALLLQLRHPRFHVGHGLLPLGCVALYVTIVGLCLRAACDGRGALGDDAAARVWARAVAPRRVVGHEEPPGDGRAQAELLEEEHLHHHPKRQPLVLRRVRARLQRQLLAVEQPAQLLPLRF